jgi:protocatechuate 3,4-dioxygenase beta subunit
MPTYPEYRGYQPRPFAGRAAVPAQKLPPTPPDIEGPFYLPSQEERDDVRDGVETNLLVVHGRVLSTDGRPVAGALLEFWQAGPDGAYDEHGPRHRGTQIADASGPGTCGHLWVRHTPTCTNTVQTGDGVCGCAERP